MHIKPLNADPHLTNDEADRELELRKARADEICAKIEDYPDDVGMDEATELRRLNGEIEQLERLKREGKTLQPHPGHRQIPGHSGGFDGRQASIPGWKAGYWGDAWTKARTKAGDTFTPSGSVTLPSLLGGIVVNPDRPRRVLDLIPSQRITGNTFSYLRETTRTHAAAAWPPQDGTVVTTKPVSTYAIDLETGDVAVIAHLSQPISRMTLLDVNTARQYIEGTMREGLMLALENEVVAGDGAPGFTGFTADPGINDDTTWQGDILTTARAALTALEAANLYDTGAYVFSPGDWESVETYQSTDGPYLAGNASGFPVNRAARQLWGRPVVVTSAIDDGTAYLADLQGSTVMVEVEGATLEWSQDTWDPAANASDFATNRLRARCEGRWGFAVTRPAGIVEFPTTGSP